MATQAISGYGAKIKIGDGGAPETFTEIPECGDIDGPGLEVEMADVTTHSSASAGANREFIPTLIKTKECTFDLNYVKSEPTHIALRTSAANRTKRNFQLINPAGTETVSFSGYVTDFSLKYPVDEAVKFDVTITPTGGLVFS